MDAKKIAARLGANGDPKLNAAADFAARLLNSTIGPSIARIVLFGSVARGEASPDSDVDVMVFTAAPLDEAREYTAQAGGEVMLEWGEEVAQLTFGLAELIQPRDYVIYCALQQGKELYSMETEEIRRLEAEKLLRKAQIFILQAEHNQAEGYLESASVGAYNAVELICRALLLLKPGVDLPSSHGGVIQIFSREYIRTDEAPATWVRSLNKGLETRSLALYNTTVTLNPDQVQPILALAQDMLVFLEKKLLL
jgi:uncharacterized protein (UPF0332 family)